MTTNTSMSSPRTDAGNGIRTHWGANSVPTGIPVNPAAASTASLQRWRAENMLTATNNGAAVPQRFTGLNDAHLGFALEQTAHIERDVYRIRYDDIQYHDICPVDTRAHQWARTITHFSQDKYGKMEPIAGNSNNFPLVELDHAEYNVTVEMFGIGYGWTMEEVGQAAMIPGMNLTSDKAMAARRASEEFLDDIVLNGNSTYGWDSLLNNSNVTKSDAPIGAKGTGATEQRLWSNKTAQEIVNDVNIALQGVYDETNTVDMANTLLIPPTVWGDIAGKVLSGTSTTVAEFIKRANVYTMKTGRRLMIREVNGLQNAAANNTGRIVAYKRDMNVLRLHLPMPFQFLPMQQDFMNYVVPGILRCGGLEIRQPKLIRYVDGITT